ncbi:hypothetical protein cypCar_00034837 [Cyprinus carpio]|nr:hypothetical protein cypCar_00034837 [Cyprinus carpio]
MFMKDGVKHLSSAAVSLTVTVKQHYTAFTEYSCAVEDVHISLIHGISKSGCWDVTYTSRRVCALVGSTVDISCTYSLPSGHTVNKTFWHYVQPGDFMDLREEHQFAGRVEYVENKLRIKELKISDSGEYLFRIITDLNQYSGSPGVNLTVTDPTSPESSTALLSTVIILSVLLILMLIGVVWYSMNSSVSFIVYVNLHKVKIMNSRLSPLILLLLIPGSITLDQLSVTCSQQSICAVKGSEVTLRCSYSNINIKTVFWFSENQSTNWRKNTEPEDLTLDSDYSGRVKQISSNYQSELTISDVFHQNASRFKTKLKTKVKSLMFHVCTSAVCPSEPLQ